LKEHLELELDERRQVEDVISFFLKHNEVEDEEDDFYKPIERS